MPKYCTHCGAPLTEGAKFCENCGAKVVKEAAAGVVSPVGENSGAAAGTAVAGVDHAAAGISHAAPENDHADTAHAGQAGAEHGGAAIPVLAQAGAEHGDTGNPGASYAGAGHTDAGHAGAGQKVEIPFDTDNPTIRDLEEKFLVYQGRLNRKPYFIRGLILGVVSWVGSVLWDVSFLPVWLLGAVICLLAFAAGVMLVIRRLHDINQTGWLALISFIPFIDILFALVLLFFKGTEGPNKYGPDPLEQA